MTEETTTLSFAYALTEIKEVSEELKHTQETSKKDTLRSTWDEQSLQAIGIIETAAEGKILDGAMRSGNRMAIDILHAKWDKLVLKEAGEVEDSAGLAELLDNHVRKGSAAADFVLQRLDEMKRNED